MNNVAQNNGHVNTLAPLAKMQRSFPAAYEKTNGWWANDDNPRFDFRELENGNIVIKPWTGRTIDDILAMGQIPISRGDLYGKPGQPGAIPRYDQKLDLLTLSEHMAIDWQFLEQEGYIGDYSYTYSKGNTVKCVKLGGYCAPDGRENPKHQVRLSLHKEPRFLWNQNTPDQVIPCGLHYLDRARAAGYLIIGEGNSDWATMTFHGIPFVGIPGTEHAKKLDVELLRDIPVIYIVEEPDQVKKLNRTGQGFYKSMRQHLRDGGYQGDIFSIRFMEATGYKDPSDLHKAVYAACKEQAEGPFRQAVHKQFIEAIEHAMVQALPEGNTVAPAVMPELTFEEFSRQVWAVSSIHLTPLQKMIVCYLFLYMRRVERDELGWRIDAKTMAPEVGLQGKKGQQKFLAELSYLYQHLGILSKEHRAVKEYVNSEAAPERVRYKGMELYIEPTVSYYVPRGYCVVTEFQHRPGGPRVVLERCEKCGSRHLKHYADQCVDCGHVTIIPSEEKISEHPKMGVPEIESITDPQNGGFGKPMCISCGSEAVDIDEVQFCNDCRRTHIIHKQEQSTLPSKPVESTVTVLPLESEPEPPVPSPQEPEPKREQKFHPPPWLIPGTPDWNKQVERNGLADMQARRNAWLERRQQERRAS